MEETWGDAGLSTADIDRIHELNHAVGRSGRLFERVLEGWEYMRPQAKDVREVEPGVYAVRGELHCKHAATDNEIVEQYEQTLEIQDGLLVKGRMVMGTAAGD